MRSAYIALLLLMTLQPVQAGSILSVEDAEKTLLANNIEIQMRRKDLMQSEAEVVGSKLLPNPEVKYLYESMGSGQNDKEITYSVVQPVDFAGKRSKRIETAEKRRDAQTLFFEYGVINTLTQMKQLYYRNLLIMENIKAITGIIEMAEESERKTAARVKAGDASEAELMKLSSEKRKFVRLRDALTTDLRGEMKKLALMLNLPEGDLALENNFEYRHHSLILDKDAEKAIADRADIKGQSTLVSAADVSIALSKREAIPSIGVEAGYKRWAGGFDGFIFGLAIPLPIFDRNQGRIAIASAERDKQRLNYELLKKHAASEISILQEKISYLQARIREVKGQLDVTKEITKIAHIAYEEGEASLIDLLDAVRSEKELVMEYNNTVYEYWINLFEAERATGTRLVKGGGK